MYVLAFFVADAARGRAGRVVARSLHEAVRLLHDTVQAHVEVAGPALEAVDVLGHVEPCDA